MSKGSLKWSKKLATQVEKKWKIGICIPYPKTSQTHSRSKLITPYPKIHLEQVTDLNVELKLKSLRENRHKPLWPQIR